MRRLLGAGASLEAADANGYTPLMAAVVNSQAAAAEELLEAGAKTEVFAAKCHASPLFVAVGVLGEAEAAVGDRMAAALLAAGASTEAVDSNGMSPLMAACGSGRLEAVKLLIRGGAKLEYRDEAGINALWTAVLFQQAAVVRELIHGGAKVDLDAEFDGHNFLGLASQLPHETRTLLNMASSQDGSD